MDNIAAVVMGGFDSEHLRAFLEAMQTAGRLAVVIPDDVNVDIGEGSILFYRMNKDILTRGTTAVAKGLSEALRLSPEAERIVVVVSGASKLPSTPGISKILKSGLDYARLSNCMFLSRKYAIHVAETEGIASSTNARKQGFRALSMISFTTHSPREAIAEFTFVRFAIVGFSGFVVNELVVSVFKFWIPSINLVMGDALGIELSIINNFIWNDIYTFKSARETNPVNSSRERVIRFLKYNLVSLSSTFVNLTVFYYLYSTLGIFYFWSLFIAIITAFVINYVGSARWAWSKFTRSKLIPTPLND